MRLASVCFLFLAVTGSAVASNGAVPSQHAEKDTDKFVRLTEALEADPLRSDGKAVRGWLMEWLTAAPDYTVTICDILGPIPNEDGVPHGPELLMQQMFGNAAYQIKTPGKTDMFSQQLAGMESVLRAYSAILAKDPGAHIPYFDDLLARQRNGSLREFMALVVGKGCAKKD
ncbi:hypothetical protein [Dyella koreensis]|uniref:Uncharacterized protein n=1 Tax=Dyella koreensis TaxID=311235 RepID=A0ABW8K8X8_9GAMM